MSDLSFAEIEELMPTPHYLFQGYLLHRRTLLKTPHGQYLFDNNWINNQGHPIAKKDKGLTYPREAIIAQYLSQWGYNITDFPAELQWYFHQKKGLGIAHVDFKSDNILGDGLHRGYDRNGKEEQKYKRSDPINLQKELQIAAEWKLAAAHEMSLSEILDQDFFLGEGPRLSSQPAGGYLYTSSFLIKNKSKLREELLRAIKQEGLGSLSTYQLRKLRRIVEIGYGGAGFPKQLGGTQIPEALAQRNREADLKKIVQMPWSQERSDKIKDYVKQYAEIPAELAKLIVTPEYNQYEIFPINTLKFPIRSISPESVRILTRASEIFKMDEQKWLILGITHFSQEVADAITFVPDATTVPLKF